MVSACHFRVHESLKPPYPQLPKPVNPNWVHLGVFFWLDVDLVIFVFELLLILALGFRVFVFGFRGLRALWVVGIRNGFCD